ncbi:MAG: hypothetical protein ACREU3_09630, partial [Steroidobacteraceae bacterium]
VWLYAPADLGWDAGEVVRALGARGKLAAAIDPLAAELAASLHEGDSVVIMSNGGFGGLHGKLLAALKRRFAATEMGRGRENAGEHSE